ncbi:PDDEXK family nuclease [Virgibacillus dakarensis]|uniref:hypothetical protein n=1 Tax=Virgibacillus dakarensis TaxID=1917889 RepID=UPI000B44DB59|nr:hypothetical protein [Virgibacillus dakarensis]
MIYTYQNANMQAIQTTSFTDEGILERQHIQSALKKNIEIVAPDCLVIAEEFSEWEDSKRRIDLLAIDKNADLVVIELKRTDTGEHMELQALRYAAMVSALTFKKVIDIYQKFLLDNKIDGDAETNLLKFLNWEAPQEEEFALNVRIVLVSSDFSKELTTTIIWLSEYGLDIRCVSIVPYKNDGKIFIDVKQVLPLPEAEEYQIKLREKSEEKRQAVKSSRDYTKYKFRGEELNKRKLVLTVIHTWIKENNPQELRELLEVFPQELNNGDLIVPLEKAQETYERQNIARHFLNDDEALIFGPSERYAISNQWGKGNIETFITYAKKAGFEIETV